MMTFFYFRFFVRNFQFSSLCEQIYFINCFQMSFNKSVDFTWPPISDPWKKNWMRRRNESEKDKMKWTEIICWLMFRAKKKQIPRRQSNKRTRKNLVKNKRRQKRMSLCRFSHFYFLCYLFETHALLNFQSFSRRLYFPFILTFVFPSLVPLWTNEVKNLCRFHSCRRWFFFIFIFCLSSRQTPEG